MNSLYKHYIKNSAIILGIGILFSILFIYLSYNNCVKTINDYVVSIRYISDYDILRIFNDYNTSCMLLNIAVISVIVYSFFMHRNNKTGIFIRQLPIKSNIDFLVKTVLILISVLILILFQIIIFKLVITNTVSEIYGYVLKENPDNRTILTLRELYTNLYDGFKNTAIIAVLFLSVIMLSSSCIGVTAFVVAMPYILYFSILGFAIGFFSFLRNLSISLNDILPNIISYYVYKLLRFDFTDFQLHLVLLIIAVILYITAYICSNHINYTKIGSIFIFKAVKYLAYFTGTILGGFSFYFIASALIDPTGIIVYITMLICFLISFIIIRKTESIFL